LWEHPAQAGDRALAAEEFGRRVCDEGTACRAPTFIPANHHDLSVTTEDESAAMESGATDAFRPAGLIRACLVLLYGRQTQVQ